MIYHTNRETRIPFVFIRVSHHKLTSSIILFFSANDIALEYATFLLDPSSVPLLDNLTSFYSTASEIFITIMTLFLSVFVLFTISQNAQLSGDSNLYRRGLAHKFARDDKYVAFISGISLVTALLASLINSLPQEIAIPNSALNKLNLIIPVLLSISISTCFIAFQSLTYYSERILTANESNIIMHILQDKILAKERSLRPNHNRDDVQLSNSDAGSVSNNIEGN